MQPLMIEVGINETTTREQNPTVPYSPAEIAKDILAVADAGACLAHFHARDPETGAQRLDEVPLYREAMAQVRAEGCDILIYPSYPPSEADVARRFRPVRELAAEPDLGMVVGMLDMGSINFIQTIDGKFADSTLMPLEASVYKNPYLHLREALEYYAEHDLLLALAVFEPGQLRAVGAFIADGTIRSVPTVKLIFSEEWLFGPLPGRAGLVSYLDIVDGLDLRDRIEWFVMPYAVSDPKWVDELIDAAIELGGHVRLGVGDLPVWSGGRSNAELVAEVRDRARAAGRPLATPDEALAMCRINCTIREQAG